MEANDQTNEKLTSLKSIVESISPKRVISLKEQIACKQDELAKRKALLGPQEKICEPKKKQLTRDDFLSWRREHDGPKSRSAFKVWRRNGGRDFENFRNNSRRGGGRGGRERGVVVNHYY
nr:uncharacterized protein LOC124810534 [Hydra vulgaris]